MKAIVASGLLCLALAGCGGGTRAHKGVTSPVQQAQQSHEYPSPPAPAQQVTSPASGPVQALMQFATRYINWSADTVAADLRSLASRSVGQARSAMELAATQTDRDYELQRGGVSNSGTVEAIAPLLNGGDEYVVVTREQTSATNTTAYAGLRPAWHLALASVRQVAPGQWAVSSWQPQN